VKEAYAIDSFGGKNPEKAITARFWGRKTERLTFRNCSGCIGALSRTGGSLGIPVGRSQTVDLRQVPNEKSIFTTSRCCYPRPVHTTQ